MTQELEGQVAIVTGSARNIGRAIALSLAEAGAAVVVNARSSAAAAAEVAGAIQAAGGRAVVHMADISDPEGAAGLIAAGVAAGVAAFGRLDILVNNAAVRRETPLEAVSFQEWRQVVGAILDGAFLCAQAAAPHLRGSEAGSIVNLGGMSAHAGSKARPHVLAAKAGLVGLTRALACDLAEDGVTVNCVSPGLIETLRADGTRPAHRPVSIPLGRRGQPEEIAGLVRYLCGPDARYVTGQVIHANGGAFFG